MPDLIGEYIAQRQAGQPGRIQQARKTGFQTGISEGLKTFVTLMIEQQKTEQAKKEAAQKAKEAEKELRRQVAEMLKTLQITKPAMPGQPATFGEIPEARVPSPTTTGLPEKLAIQEPVSVGMGIERKPFPASLFQAPTQVPAQTLTPYQKPPLVERPATFGRPAVPGQPEQIAGHEEIMGYIETGKFPEGYKIKAPGITEVERARLGLQERSLALREATKKQADARLAALTEAQKNAIRRQARDNIAKSIGGIAGAEMGYKKLIQSPELYEDLIDQEIVALTETPIAKYGEKPKIEKKPEQIQSGNRQTFINGLKSKGYSEMEAIQRANELGIE